jgi:hypothetical protein
MEKTTNTTEEKTLLKPFPFNSEEEYLLKLADGRYVVAYWEFNSFISQYGDGNPIEEKIGSIVSLKELGL